MLAHPSDGNTAVRRNMITRKLRHAPGLKIISRSAAQPPDASQRRHSLVIWTTLIGVCFPAVPISLGIVNVTLGRIVVIIFLLPALAVLSERGRAWVTSDFFAVALAIWMLASSALNGGFRPYVGAEALEFLGSYLVGRAFIFGPSNLQIFITALTRTTVVVVGLGLVDTLSGTHVTLDSLGIAGESSQYITANDYRLGLVRASSVFEGSEHFGTFCVAAASIFFYSVRSAQRKIWLSVSFLGCALSLSSGPLMGLCVVVALFSYDRILRRNSTRWKALLTLIAGFLVALFAVSSDPISWLLVHMTFNPQTGFVRLGQWDAAAPLVGSSPFIGHGYIDFGDSFYLSNGIDCIWLVEALHYGIPGVVLLLLTMLSSFFSKGKIFRADFRYLLCTDRVYLRDCGNGFNRIDSPFLGCALAIFEFVYRN